MDMNSWKVLSQSGCAHLYPCEYKEGLHRHYIRRDLCFKQCSMFSERLALKIPLQDI